MTTNGSAQKMEITIERWWSVPEFSNLWLVNIEFDEVRGRIIARQPLPSIGEVFSDVRREENRRSVMLLNQIVTSSIESSALANPTGAAMSRNLNTQRKTDEKARV